MYEDNSNDTRYRVITVEETTAPEGMQGDNWCLYVIKLGESEVASKKTGSLMDVTEHANHVAEMLNDRYARGGTAFAARNKG